MAPKFLPHMRMSVMARAITAFDKASGIIIASIWGAAIVLCIMADVSVGRALHAHEDLATAEASTPLTPTVAQNNVPANDMSVIVDKLQKRYGTMLQVSNKKGESIIHINSKDAASFSTWLTAITYLDIIRPDISWKIDTFCVGSKCGDTIMMGQFSAKAVSFELPQSSEDE